MGTDIMSQAIPAPSISIMHFWPVLLIAALGLVGVVFVKRWMS